MRWRVVVLPLAAALIYGVCEYRLSLQTVRSRTDIKWNGQFRLAPSFEATDAQKRPFRLQRYIGRQAILLVFFDGKLGAANDPTIKRLVEQNDQLAAKGVLVIAVSNALPQTNRHVQLPSNFKLITDLDPLWAAHRIWNSFDEEHEQPIAAAYAIDRAGYTFANFDGIPTPIADLDEWLRR